MATVELKPVAVIKARLGIEPNGRVQRKFQSLCQEYMDKYVPYQEGSGNLRKNLDMSNPTQIVYESPYAHYQYEGVLWVMENGKGAYYSPSYGFWSKKPKHKTDTPLHYHTAGTGNHWNERMKSAEMDNLIEDLQKFIDRGGK